MSRVVTKVGEQYDMDYIQRARKLVPKSLSEMEEGRVGVGWQKEKRGGYTLMISNSEGQWPVREG